MADETAPLLKAARDAEDVPDYGNANTGAAVVHEVHAEQPDEPTKSGVTAGIFVPLAIGVLLVSMDSTIVVASYASIGSDLHQLQNTSWIATGYMLTITSFQPLYGKLSDIFGRKPCLLFAYSVFCLGCLFCGLARNMNELIAARAFAGIGGGGMTTLSSIIFSDIVPLRSRGTWQGIMNIVFATGASIGAPAGGLLADSIGWRWSFLIQVPATIVAIATVAIALELPNAESSDLRAKIKRIDFAGAFTLVLAVFFLLFGLDRGGNISWNEPWTIAALAAFGIFFALFAFVEMEFASEPFAPKRIIVNSSLLAAYLVNFFGIAAGLSMLFYVSLYLQAVQRQSAAQAGLWLLPSIIASVAGSLVGGLLIQATGKYYAITATAYVAQFAGALIVALATGVIAHSYVGIVVGLVIASLGNGCGITTSLIALIANAGQADQAVATAVSYLFRSLGSVVGVSVGSTLVQDTLQTRLRAGLGGADVEEVIRRVLESLAYVDELEPEAALVVRGAYEQAVHVTLWFTVAMAACAAISSFFIKEKSLKN